MHHKIVLFYKRYITNMTQRKLDREHYRRKKQNGRIVYPKNLQDEQFPKWFKSKVSHAKQVGHEIDDDVLV